MKICQANNATPIILASGYLPNSEIIVSLIAQDIHYFIFDSEQGKIKEEFPNFPVIATGGPNEETIRKTIEAGANAITYTPPTNGDTMSSLMDKYRSL